MASGVRPCNVLNIQVTYLGRLILILLSEQRQGDCKAALIGSPNIPQA